ncbi:RecF/RecN/SMC N terminal domain-containing protein [Debaryomyces fabryi]|uniref:Structural maintenance of chromosomes protein n=1 Tax=Debaryomyces fabryi TaxID=58627 RepID=A0A0V1Q652_9ASCO|nr:RecF/RecN/SMC N terminal domain-containing protein [Debaryomyces fabryi]KSA03988.1 RecF/RecN/SMC N terminal domain-containing protein [Debaryomyces fabryi]CUM53783.1 unnamed protein product [Debaryomyces fabryi]
MGRLVGLELENFKSYRGTSSIGFGTSFFTSIIGPNGAGKSNMMDAISFVLGVKSSHLRSHNLKDLIYRGRRTNVNALDSTLEEISPDPTRASVMAIYEKDNGEILNLKRIITSTGSSEYKINDKSVTALQYSLVLKNENILIKARNFLVFQGDVEQIASQSPKDLTKLIETISGAIEYQHEYEKLKDELEKAHESSNVVFSRKRTLNSESKQYKEQLIEQETFEKKLIDKNNLIKMINLYKIYHNEKKHFQLHDELKSKNEELNLLKQKLKTEEKSYKSMMTDYSKKLLNVKSHTKKVSDFVRNIESEKRNLIPVNANKKSLVTKINASNNKIKDLKNDVKKQQKQVLSIENQLRDAKKMFNEFQEKVAASSSSSVSPESQKEYDDLRAKFLANGGSQLEEDLSLLLNEKDSIDSMITNYSNQKQNSNYRISDLESIIQSELKTKLGETSSEINDILSLKSEKVEYKNSLIKKKEQFNYQELELNSKLRDILVKLDELASQQRESNKQRKLRENVTMLKKLFPKGAVKGIVYDLVRPAQYKYEAALLTILGRNFDAIIVETTSIAYKCIEILKERRSGVCTFIPLDSVVNDSLNLNYLRSVHPSAQPGIDILEYDDSSLEQAIQYVTGDTLVVDNIEVARSIKWGSGKHLDNKMVTLDGSVIHKSGLMTGGQQHQTSNKILSWDQNEWNSLSNIKDDLTERLTKLSEEKPKELEINMVSDEISHLDDKLPLLRTQKANIERVIEDRSTEINFQLGLIKEFEASIQNKAEILKTNNEKIEALELKVKELQETVYHDFCERHGYENGIEDYENLHGSTLRIRAKERTQFLKAIDTLSNKLNFEKEKLAETESRETAMKQQLKELEENIEEVMSEKETFEDRIDNFEAELQVLQTEKNDLETELNSMLKVSRSLESNVNEFNNELSNLNKQIAGMEESILKVDIERVNILKNCKIESINLPLKDGILDSISISENADLLIKDIYEIEVDYSLLSEKLKESFNSKIEAELKARLEQIIEDIEQLTPNAKAVQRLKEVETKLKSFDKDFTKARQQENKIVEKFNAIKEKRYELFSEAFSHISGQIDFIYKELTKSSTSPLGGSAYLTLEDEEEPYNAGIKYHAMPPMKRFRDMDLLSGGEKTIAALALLFAIHSFQPSPFFVLDEVDAALDNSNVNKIANYIKKYAGPNFQFIVISLKSSLFERSDALVGIYREQRENSSKTVTLDLRDYSEEEVPIANPSVSVA